MKRFLICLIVLIICGVVFDASPQSSEKEEVTVVLTVNSDNGLVSSLMRTVFFKEFASMSDVTLLSDSKKTHAYDFDADWDFWIGIKIIETESKKYAVSANIFYRVPSIFIVERIRETFSKKPGVFAPGDNLLMILMHSEFDAYCTAFCSVFEEVNLKAYRELDIR